MAPNAEPAPIRVTLGHYEDDSLIMRFPPDLSDEILALLDEHELEHSTGLEFAADVSEWIEAVRLFAAAGGLFGFAAVIKALAHRHDGKRISFKRLGKEIDATGFSAKEIERLIEGMAGDQAQLDEETRKRMGDSSKGGS